MRLKTVKVHGFKTFANPTEFSFQDGITAIVGPNGCGKSNIADAIRWALGEQSPSNLRTKKTEDLIFTGSATRPKLGMAEVALTLENPFSFETDPDAPPEPSANGDHSNGDTPTQTVSVLQQPGTVRTSIVEEILRARPSEVTILRRAYRSGENEYLINRQRVRLRDVQELLQRWGLARLTYAVIGQGLIDQALSLRAEERRALFEEAAGIGLYQNKKANALEKLEETQQNLIRVNDIINEIAPRLPSLARQADRAGKYEAVSTALNASLKQWYAFNWAHAQEGFITASDQEQAARERLNEQRGLMQDLAAQLMETRRTAQNLRAKLAEHRRAQQQREGEFAAREREFAILQERMRFAETQHNDAQRELEATTLTAQSTLTALEQFAAQPLQLEPEPAVENETALVGEHAQTPTDTLADTANVTVLSMDAETPTETPDPFAEIQTQHNAEIQALAKQQRAAEERHEAEIAKLTDAENQALADWTTEQERTAAVLEQTLGEQRAQYETNAQKLAAEREQTEYERALALARQRLAQLRLTEFDAAPSLVLSAESDDSPVEPAAPDLAAHLILLQEQLPLYESALASVAGLAAQADDMARRERTLREHEKMVERARQEANETKSALAFIERDVQSAQQALVNAQREWERTAKERAQERERTKRDRQREQERAREQFQLRREKIAAERERQRREHAQQLRERELRLQEWVREQEREKQREAERVQEREREQQRERLREIERQQERERERVRERERILREHAQTQERLSREHERALREQEAKTARVTTFASQVAELLHGRAAAQAQVDEMRAALQALNEVAFPDETALNESEARQTELEEREAELRSGLTVAEELHNRAVLEAERRRAEIARLEQEIEDDLGPVELDSATPRQLRLRLVVRPRTVEGSEQISNADKRTNAEQNVNSLTADNVGETTSEAQDIPEQELVTLPDVEALPDGFDKEIRRLKNQMRYIGNVNPNAPQEYAELRERHAFLTEQALDLTQAIEKLQLATAELDTMMKQKFLETFDAINVQFKNYFAMLFGGGSGRLELTEPNDIIHSGIEITARPPGKRQAQLVLLSGGERALTAAALIFSILKVSPTPFCVMDEVDAALDEANVGRFRDGLKELSGASQMIVITHNRVTMEGARAIYGVSMGEDGISQVLSLQLEQATENAR